MTPHHEHEFEAEPGLPQALPPGERILWQGAPDWRQLCVHAFHLRGLALYFAGMLALQGLMLRAEGGAVARPLVATAALGAAGLALLAATAWLAARTTLYTLTSRRLVMRIGIVLTITLNLPLRQLRGADLLARSGGVGDVSLSLAGRERLGWLHLWPHARPWQLRDPQPSLRCIPDAQAVGTLLVEAWQQAMGEAAVPAVAPSTSRPGIVSMPAAVPPVTTPEPTTA